MTEEFLKAYLDFAKDCIDDVENLEYLFYEQQASELELPTDYFIQEFILK